MRSFEEIAKDSAKAQGLPTEKEVKTDNDFRLGLSENLPNTTHAQRGQQKFVTSRTHGNQPIIHRTKQAIYRYCAWLILFAEILPDEPGQEGITFEQVSEAVRDKGHF